MQIFRIFRILLKRGDKNQLAKPKKAIKATQDYTKIPTTKSMLTNNNFTLLLFFFFFWLQALRNPKIPELNLPLKKYKEKEIITDTTQKVTLCN